tara:strand:+ start:558 stop:1007 length:450 start_codon:yes stop_codon:yes gene_type:complete
MTEQEGFIPIPNKIFDKYMRELKPTEFLVLCAIIRKTWGWRKKEDKISVSQLMELTSCTNKTIISSLNELEKRKIISTKKRFKKTTKIRLNLKSSSGIFTQGKASSSGKFPSESSGIFTHTTIHNNTYKPQRDPSPILGGLMDWREYED